MNDKTKTTMRSRLAEILNSPNSQRDFCLAVIAICLLDGIPTEEELTRHGSSLESQFCEQEGALADVFGTTTDELLGRQKGDESV